MSITDSKCEYGYLYYQNNSEDGTLVEKILFKKLENYVFLPPYDDQNLELEVVVPPKESRIVIMRRTAREASYSIAYYAKFEYTDNKYIKDLQHKGKKITATYKDVEYDIFVYTMYGGSSFYFLFSNETADYECDATF